MLKSVLVILTAISSPLLIDERTEVNASVNIQCGDPCIGGNCSLLFLLRTQELANLTDRSSE